MPNALLGWSGSLPGSGNGAKSFGQEIESSTQFAACQVQKVFQAMCLRLPSNAADRAQVAQITADFVSSNYNMKTAFAEKRRLLHGPVGGHAVKAPMKPVDGLRSCCCA